MSRTSGSASESRGRATSHLSIFSDIRTFETELRGYIESVQNFNPDLGRISKLLQTDARIEDFIKLLINHQNFGSNLRRLQAVDAGLNGELLGILDRLNECRNMLLDLPDDYGLEDDVENDEAQEEEEEKKEAIAQLEGVFAGKDADDDVVMKEGSQAGEEDRDATRDTTANTATATTTTTAAETIASDEKTRKEAFGDSPLTTGELLKYAARLAKFTTMPATSDLNIGPNNYIWPAEDALRKGMLATAMRYKEDLVSYKKKEAEKKEEDTAVPAAGENRPEQHAPVNAPVSRPTEYQHERSGSFDAYHRPSITETADKRDESPAVALDLFDSDEESD